MTTDTPHQDDPFVGMHYRVCGYVARDRIVPSPFDGFVTFTRIVQERPTDCRFAVAQIVRIHRTGADTFTSDDHSSGPCVVWDLFDDQLVRGQRSGPTGMISPPPPLWMADSEDGMLMKALAFFEHHP